ncbi:MAG: hypothetical protein AB1481_06420 [Candidatus Omnitrophota bacterium]
MKILERNRAIELRRQGKTFSEVLKEIPVSKGTLSYWLKDIALTPEQLAKIQYKNDKVKSKFIEFNRLRKLQAERNKQFITDKAMQEIGILSKRELKMLGAALYWAEGHKTGARAVDFVNTDAAMIKLMMRWFRETCAVEEEQFRIRISIHNPADAEKAKSYWSGITGVPLTQFTKIYTKLSPTSGRKVGNLAPYGICAIRVSDISLITRIKGWIKGLMALSSSLV